MEQRRLRLIVVFSLITNAQSLSFSLVSWEGANVKAEHEPIGQQKQTGDYQETKPSTSGEYLSMGATKLARVKNALGSPKFDRFTAR